VGEVTYVFLAGVGNSGPGHWQRLWHERLPDSVWVEHADWDGPERDAWVAEMQRTVWRISGPMLVVAHSLGCLLLAEWARGRDDPSLVGAFLVAAPNPDRPDFPPAVRGFDDPTAAALAFPSLVVASQDDPYADMDYARESAATWGSQFVDVGARGHINADSGLGDWPEGWQLLQDFVSKLDLNRR
jgi:predicted alpha/beta hydrolase family esterase